MPSLSYLISDTLHCLGKFVLYVVPCLAVLLIIYKFAKLPQFVFRKVLHMVAFTCITLMIYVAECWQSAVLASVVIALVAYPVLAALERLEVFAKFFVQKSPGEIKRSVIWLFSMFAALTAISWGIFKKDYAGMAAILMWGTGDAAAALIGVPFGKHKVKSKFTDGKKSYEGSMAMFTAAFLFGLVFLVFLLGIPPAKALPAAIVGALVGALTELFTASEYDTITVPIAILAVMLIMI